MAFAVGRSMIMVGLTKTMYFGNLVVGADDFGDGVEYSCLTVPLFPCRTLFSVNKRVFLLLHHQRKNRRAFLNEQIVSDCLNFLRNFGH